MPNMKNKMSKRVSCRQRYKVEKKVRQHLKKKKKEAKKNPNKHKPKDPGIPNSLPFKGALLKEAQLQQQMREEQRRRQKEARQDQHAKHRDLGELQADAVKRQAQHAAVSGLLIDHLVQTGQDHLLKELSNRTGYQELRKVVEAADVVLQVLDARDPLGTRSPQLEQLVQSRGKRLVLLLNKIDLIPRENLTKWLRYLRRELPTIAFKASTQTQKKHLSQQRAAPDVETRACLGAQLLLKLLGNYCRNQGIQGCITVGVVGYPNVGKSSLVNSLKRTRACTVGAVPGVTKYMQRVQLDSHVWLLDSPGVVLASGDATEATVALRNAKSPQSLEDPVGPACSILRRASREQLMLQYRLPEYGSPEELLLMLAKRMGRLRKGALPDAAAAARKILSDWNCGRIKYCTEPPEDKSNVEGSSIVSALGAEFDLDAIAEEEERELKGLPVVRPMDVVPLESMGTADMAPEEETSTSMDTGQESSGPQWTAEAPRKKATSAKVTSKSESGIESGLQQNKARRKEFKKMLKKRKRSDKVASALSDSLESALAGLGGSE
ncbi:guanine nucleotide-binding protein-like 3 homolog isoform X1 [Dermacentor albipictus]|uniref:guanine nucleotide-binding protein-like 3 homolog isoform X1 n=2 Tax=Dermacentor albipictus TaxID=60249 RepID=UPI0031FD3953